MSNGERVGWKATHRVCRTTLLTVAEDSEEFVRLSTPCACDRAVWTREQFAAECYAWMPGDFSTPKVEVTLNIAQVDIDDRPIRRMMAAMAKAAPRIVTTWHSVVSATYGGSIVTCEHDHATQSEAEACARKTGRESLVMKQTDGTITEGRVVTASWAAEAVAARDAERAREIAETDAARAAEAEARVAQERARWTGWADGDIAAERDRRLRARDIAEKAYDAAKAALDERADAEEEVAREVSRRSR